jgi:hypothetical protein
VCVCDVLIVAEASCLALLQQGVCHIRTCCACRKKAE